MIKTNANKNSLKEIREREKAEKDKNYRDQCETILTTRIGGDSSKIAELSNKHKGLWYLPALDEEGNVEKMLVLKPIDRNILSYASTKIADDGLYAFLEAAMNECILKEYSDMEMMNDDDYFIPAANSFNKIMEGKKTALLKR
jgi:hypothetical protein